MPRCAKEADELDLLLVMSDGYIVIRLKLKPECIGLCII